MRNEPPHAIRHRPTQTSSTEAAAQFLDDLSQIVRIIFEDLPNLGGARRLGLDLAFVWDRFLAGWFHVSNVGADLRRMLDPNQRKDLEWATVERQCSPDICPASQAPASCGCPKTGLFAYGAASLITYKTCGRCSQVSTGPLSAAATSCIDRLDEDRFNCECSHSGPPSHLRSWRSSSR